LRHDSQLLAEILARIVNRLPYALVPVFDQIEEVFTLAKTPEEVASRDHALRMLQRVVDVRADVKLIISLRTEYYGRLLDHLRAGRRDLTGVRDDLLRDFSRSALIDTITRPTSDAPLAGGQPSPREKYGFRYADGIPEAIADGVLAMRSENQDSVLPLAQVICTQLYERKQTEHGSDGVITREDLDAIKGVEGGLKTFAEDALVRSLHLGPEDRESFKALFSKLYNRQPDGTLTTWLMPRSSLECQWDRPTPFAEMLEAAKSFRLLREDELRIEGDEPRRYVRLGHDALAKVAAAWKAELEENQRLEEERMKRLEERLKRLRQRRRLAGAAVFCLTLAGLFGWLGLEAKHEARRAGVAEENAKDEAEHARTAEKRATTAQEKAEREANHARLAEDSAKREAEHAEKAAQEAKRQERVAQITSARLALDRGLALCERDDLANGLLWMAHSLQIVPSDAPEIENVIRGNLGAWFPHLNRLRKILPHGHIVRSVSFHPGGQIVITGSEDRTARLWDVESGLLIGSALTHADPVNSVGFSHDGRSFVTGCHDGMVKLWDTATQRQLREPLHHPGPVWAVAFSPDDRFILSGCGDHRARL
jgi:WD domain, G-beta repeat